jgi:regulator of cell morphogenesis and NO signaling
MSFTVSNTVGEMARKLPGAIQVFENFGIDYCCGGHRTLNEVCRTGNISIEEVLSLLTQDDSAAQPQPVRDWGKEPLSSLVDYILQTHHVFTKQEIMRLENLFQKVCAAHARNHAELLQLKEQFLVLKSDLLPHMMKEENILFPYIKAVEAAISNGQKSPSPFFNTVRNPVRVMMTEHDNAGEMLRRLRALSNNYTVPADGCTSFQALYEALKAFEADLHQHIHLENNILFPRTIELEKAAQVELQSASAAL